MTRGDVNEYLRGSVPYICTQVGDYKYENYCIYYKCYY